VALQALTNLGRLSSRRWQSFPTAPDGTGKAFKYGNGVKFLAYVATIVE
jgi:hypothetical protein